MSTAMRSVWGADRQRKKATGRFWIAQREVDMDWTHYASGDPWMGRTKIPRSEEDRPALRHGIGVEAEMNKERAGSYTAFLP